MRASGLLGSFQRDALVAFALFFFLFADPGD